ELCARDELLALASLRFVPWRILAVALPRRRTPPTKPGRVGLRPRYSRSASHGIEEKELRRNRLHPTCAHPIPRPAPRRSLCSLAQVAVSAEPGCRAANRPNGCRCKGAPSLCSRPCPAPDGMESLPRSQTP